LDLRSRLDELLASENPKPNLCSLAHIYAKTSLDYFREYIRECKNSQGILKNETPIGVGFPFSKMSHVFLFNKTLHDTPSHIITYYGEKVKNNIQAYCLYMLGKTLDHKLY
jgi:hypothetical protein